MKQIKLFFLSVSMILSFVGNAQASGLINLITTQAGIHRISYTELAQAGADLQGVRHNRLRLFTGDQEVAIRTVGQRREAGRPAIFGPGGFIEFYAEAVNSQYTDEAAFTLHLLNGKRLEIAVEKHQYKKRLPAATDYLHTTVIEENRSYDFLAPSNSDPWHYGQIFGAGGLVGPTYSFSLEDVVGNSATLSAEVYGIVDIPVEDINDHHPEIVVNGVPVADQQFDGTTIATLSADNVSINNGANTLRVDLKGIAGMPFDALALNRFSVTYSRETEAVNNYLQGYFAAGQAQVSGISAGQKAAVYRKGLNGVTRITGVRKLSADISGFNTGSGGEFIVVGAGGYKIPSVAMLHDLDDISQGSAEYLIISHASFMGEDLDALVQLRQADYTVKVVDVAQIYGQFGSHVPDASAIHAYIKHAVAHMDTRFVVLVGSDTYDYKGYISNSISYIPTLYASTPGGFLTIHQTPSDAMYGDLDGDNVPDVPVGRMSVRTPQELGWVVEKIRDYRARIDYSGQIMIAADKHDAGNQVNFTSDANALINAISEPDWKNSLVGDSQLDWRAFPDVDGDQLARTKLISGMNAGVSVAAYIGHSSQSVWGSTTPILLTASDVQNLTNIDKPALVTQWGCWNTYFVDPSGNSMGDQFLVAGETGAATVLGASTLTTSSGERILGIELNKRMYQQGMTIGEAVIQAKQAMAIRSPRATDILLGWQILGDPALVVNP